MLWRLLPPVDKLALPATIAIDTTEVEETPEDEEEDEEDDDEEDKDDGLPFFTGD